MDRDEAIHEDILELRQRMSDVERSLDGNLSEAYTNWIESADEATAAGIKEDFRRVLNDCNDRLRLMRDSVRRFTPRETPSPVPIAVPAPAPRLRNTFEKRPIPKFSGEGQD